MANNKDYMGGAFDFNRDGHTSFTEKSIGYDIANKSARGSYSKASSDNDGCFLAFVLPCIIIILLQPETWIFAGIVLAIIVIRLFFKLFKKNNKSFV